MSNKNQVVLGYGWSVHRKIILPEIEASARATAKIRIKIKAGTASLKYDTKTKISISKTEPQRSVVTSAYRFNAGRLPGIRISKISSMTIGSNSGEPVAFFIELSLLESKEWADWFMTGAGWTGGGGQPVGDRGGARGGGQPGARDRSHWGGDPAVHL